MNRYPLDPGRRPDRAAFVIAAVLAGLGVLLIREGISIPDRGGYSGIGPGDVPRLIGWCLVGLGVWTAVAAFRGEFEARPRQDVPAVLWIIGGLVLQLVLLKPAGFAVASGLLFACTAAAFGKRKLWITVPIGVGFALAIYGVFDRILQLNLPGGPIETLIFGG